MDDSWDFADDDEIAPGPVALRRLGGGRSYEAYLAWDERLFAPVVVKIVRPDQVGDRHTLRGLDREARTLGRLNHPGIVRTFGAVLGGSRPHLVLENLDGPRLSTLLRRHGPLALEQLLPLALEICRHRRLHGTRAMRPAAYRVTRSTRRRLGSRRDPLRGRNGIPTFRARPGDTDREAAREWPQLTESRAPFPRTIPDAVTKPIAACLQTDPADRPNPSKLANELEPLVAALPKPVLGGFRPARR